MLLWRRNAEDLSYCPPKCCLTLWSPAPLWSWDSSSWGWQPLLNSALPSWHGTWIHSGFHDDFMMIALMVIYNTRWCVLSFVNLKIWSQPISESFGYILYLMYNLRYLYSQKFGLSSYRWINTVIHIFNCYDYSTCNKFLS